VLILLLAYQLGFFRVGSLGNLQSQFPHWLALIVGITFHEFSHGFVATRFGDGTPRRAGRLTLNPLKHLDPIGTLMILVGPIGWGRPMPINPNEMRNPNLGWALSSAAGPISNVLVALVTVVALGLAGSNVDRAVVPYATELLRLNLGLAVFNLVPLPPLDGFGFIFGLSPRPIKIALAPLWQFGPLLLLALLFLPQVAPGFPPILPNAIGAGINYLTNLLLDVYRAF
jgi:Zn-dependent protease